MLAGSEGHADQATFNTHAQHAGKHTPWRQETARRDQGLPKAETDCPCRAARASQAEDHPTAGRRDPPQAPAMQAAAAASAGQRPVSKQRNRQAPGERSQEQRRASTATPRAAPPASRAPACAAQERQLKRRGERAKPVLRAGGGNDTTGCFPCSVRPWIPSCARISQTLSALRALACTPCRRPQPRGS